MDQIIMIRNWPAKKTVTILVSFPSEAGWDVLVGKAPFRLLSLQESWKGFCFSSRQKARWTWPHPWIQSWSKMSL